VRWIEHAHTFASSVIILIIDQDRILAFKGERETPIATDADRPMFRQRTFQRMKFPTRSIHIGRTLGVIKSKKLSAKPVLMFGLDSTSRPCAKEPFDTAMPEALNHCVKCIDTLNSSQG